MLESQRFGNLFDCSRRVEHPLFGYGNHLQLDIFLRCLSGFRLYQIPEVVGRKANLVGELFHGRDSFPRRRIRIEVIVQQPLETRQRIVIHILAGDELTFVKAHTVVEQHLDVGNNQRFGEFVDGMLQLTDNLFHIILQDDTLLCRKVQSLVGSIREKRILLHLLPQ